MKFAQFKDKDYTKEIAQVAALIGDETPTQEKLGQVAERPPGSSGNRPLSNTCQAYNTHNPAAGSHTPGHNWRTSP